MLVEEQRVLSSSFETLSRCIAFGWISYLEIGQAAAGGLCTKGSQMRRFIGMLIRIKALVVEDRSPQSLRSMIKALQSPLP